ncbi:hypothetical protein [Streptomyces sp. S465]|uniref:hypothetical protein n=1 Tax=Streptomyces sp. S465 TaxID=2979468 RepID=UPI0022A89711|nr:hypothetical protein [Streptomyces sp. S465]WAP61123.1 hypothetical protein N6H00_31370 [Streptomyces sp. S465]
MRDAVRDLLGEVSAPSVPGAHYAHNAVAALAAGVALGIRAHNLASALGSYTGVIVSELRQDHCGRPPAC